VSLRQSINLSINQSNTFTVYSAICLCAKNVFKIQIDVDESFWGERGSPPPQKNNRLDFVGDPNQNPDTGF